MDKKIILVTTIDGINITTDRLTVLNSGLLKNLIEEYGDDNPIQIPEIKGNLIKTVIDFLELMQKNTFTVNLPKPLPNYDLKEFLKDWEYNFISKFNNSSIHELFELINAANYLDVPNLLEISCAYAATLVKDYDKDKFMEVFQIQQDMTDEDLKNMEYEYEKKKEEEIEKIKLLEKERENEKISGIEEIVDDL